MKTATMKFEVQFNTSYCTFVGATPEDRLVIWSGQALLMGKEVADVYEGEGCKTEAAVIRLLKEKIRSYTSPKA